MSGLGFRVEAFGALGLQAFEKKLATDFRASGIQVFEVLGL